MTSGRLTGVQVAALAAMMAGTHAPTSLRELRTAWCLVKRGLARWDGAKFVAVCGAGFTLTV